MYFWSHAPILANRRRRVAKAGCQDCNWPVVVVHAITADLRDRIASRVGSDAACQIPHSGCRRLQSIARQEIPMRRSCCSCTASQARASHMFLDLIPLLANRFHIVAPDLSGFGQFDMPPREKFSYTFDNVACAEPFDYAPEDRSHQLNAFATSNARDEIVATDFVRQRSGQYRLFPTSRVHHRGDEPRDDGLDRARRPTRR